MFGLRVSSFKLGFLAVAGLMLASGAALAHGGGGHGGGGHGGGHGGGGHGGGGHFGGVGHVHTGGFNHGVGSGIGLYGGGFNRGLGYGRGGNLYGRGYGLGYGLGYGYGLYGRGYGYGLGGLGIGYGLGYGLGSGGYGGYGLGYGGYGYGSGYGYGGGYSPGYGNAALYNNPAFNAYSSYYPQIQAQQQPQVQAPAKDSMAHLLVIVPEGAELWFNGSKTAQTGAQREFVSPVLTPGKSFTYEIKASWMENGKPVEHTRSVHVQADAWQVIDFTKPAMPATPN